MEDYTYCTMLKRFSVSHLKKNLCSLSTSFSEKKCVFSILLCWKTRFQLWSWWILMVEAYSGKTMCQAEINLG